MLMAAAAAASSVVPTVSFEAPSPVADIKPLFYGRKKRRERVGLQKGEAQGSSRSCGSIQARE